MTSMLSIAGSRAERPFPPAGAKCSVVSEMNGEFL